MEGRGRSRARKKRRYASPKRLLSFLLTAAMVLTNMGPDLSLAYAATATDVTFEMEGADLVQSVEDAIAEGNEVTKGDIDFTEGAVDKFENLFFGEGKLYEAYPEMEGGDAEAELRVFVRLPEDADDTYIVTGDEDLIFLYVNNGEDRITCKAEIHSVINGRERTKTTKKVSIKSYLNAYDTIFGEGTEVEEEEEVVTATSSDADKAEPEVPTATDSDGQVSLSVNDVPLVTEAPVETATDSDAPESDDDEAEVPEDTEDEEPAEEEEITEDVDEEVPEAPKATDLDLVALDWNRTAKAWVTSLNALGLERSTEEGSYVLTVNHILTDGGEMWGKEETIELTEKDFTNGALNTAPYEYVKDGMELAGKAPVVRATDFQGEDGTYELTVDMEYRVMDGWHIVRETAQPGIMLMAIYIGELDKVDIEPDANQIPVHVQYVYEGGVTAKPAETIMAVKEDAEDPEAKYQFSLTVDGFDEYSISVESVDDNVTYEVDGNTVTVEVDPGTESASLVITFVAEKVKYTIQKHLQQLNSDDYDDGGTIEAFGTAGEVTEVVAETVPGYTALPIDQKKIEANGSTVVDVYYVRNTYTVTYDTNGGSYVKALKGLYEQEVTVYEVGEQKRVCGMGEHQHTDEPESWELAFYDVGDENGCWKVAKQGGLFGQKYWVWNCELAAHTHSSDCYVDSYNPAPTKQGYTFAGWYTDEKCTQLATPTLELTADTTVYAKWNPAQVRYTVVYYIENADDDNYSYLSSEVKTATVGTSVQETADTVNPVGLDTTNFTFESSEEKTIAANGSTVIRVNYDRNEYTLTSEKYFDANGNEYNSKGQGRNKLTLTARYGATITQAMNKAFNEPTLYRYAWSTTGIDKDKVAVFDTMPSGNKTVYNHDYVATREQTLRYWLENYDGSEKIEKYGKTYGLYKEITVRFNYLTYNADFYEFPGYTKYIAEFDGRKEENWSQKYTWDDMQVDFYYNADEYTLDLFGYNGELITSESVKLGADIESYLAEPEKPVEGAKFKGWYLDPQHSEKYAGDYKMPQGLSLYADWDLPTYTVTYVSEEETIHTESVEYLGTPASYIPEKEGYVFEGWYADKDGVTEADLLKPVESDITVYAQWSVNTLTTYTIQYQTEDGTVVRDPETYDGVVGTTISVKAKTPTVEAYKDYAVNVMSETITLQAAASQNVITFIYTAPTELEYTVQYKYGDDVIYTDGPIDATASKFRCTPSETAVNALKAMGYRIDDVYRDVQLVSDNTKNIVVFNLRMDTYTITYKGVNDVTVWGGETKDENPNPTTYTVNSENITLVNPSKNGSEFTGWACDDSTEVLSGSGQHDPMNVVIQTGSKGNLTFTAGWDAIETENITGKYADAEDENPNDEIYHQGEADLAVYLDGELVQSGTLKYGYWQYPCVDMAITLKRDYILNSVYADQVEATGNPTDIYVNKNDEGKDVIHVDNVADESTVYVYLTTKYTVQYVTNPAGLVTNPTDNNVYTVVNRGTPEDGYKAYTPDLTEYLEEIIVKPMPQKDGYTATGWTTEANAIQNAGKWDLSDALDADAADSDTVITLTATYGANSYAVGVQYYYDGVAGDKYDDPELKVFGTTYTITADPTKEHDGKPYALDHVEKNGLIVGADPTQNIVEVYYALDEIGSEEGPDGIPDKYQTIVTFKAENGNFGTYTNEDNEEVKITETTKIVTLEKDGKWAEDGSYELEASDIPTAYPDDTYVEPGTWNPKNETTGTPEDEVITKNSNRTFTIRFSNRASYAVGIQYYYDGVAGDKYDDPELKVFGTTYTITADPTKEHDGKPYALDHVEKNGLIVGADPTQNIVEVYYALDEIGSEEGPDGIPDKYQTIVTFKAENGNFGTYTNEDNEEVKITETTKIVTLEKDGKWAEDGSYELEASDIPTAYPDDTYVEPGTWNPKNETTGTPEDEVITKNSNRTFTIRFSNRASYAVGIQYYYDGVAGDKYDDPELKVFGSTYTITPATTKEYNEIPYALDRVENNGLTVTDNTDTNIVMVYYALDENEDKIPDKYQTTVTFKAVNGYFYTETNEDGTETKVTETQIIVDLTDASGEVYDEDGTYVLKDKDIPKATPDETYTEPGTWSPVPQNAEIRKDRDNTFTITFSNRAKYEASVEYYYDNDLDESKTYKEDRTIETVFEITPPTTTTHGDQNDNYMLGRIENNGLIVTADPAQNVIRVYYELDVKGEEPAGGDPFDPDGPDNIPDKYQVIFRYTTDGNGTVTGKTYEPYTTPKDEDGNYTEFNGASPKVNVTVSGNTSRYVFDYWTDDNGNQYDTDDVLRRAKFDDDTTFTAHFRYVSGGGHGGGGGGSSSGGSPYSDPDHGPGVVNIDPDAVPLAPLPGDNMFVIEDGDVPLAPLPKTGQTPVAPAMGMLFAGIFLALASLRRREEEN